MQHKHQETHPQLFSASLPDIARVALIGIVALLLRVLDLGRFLHSDEINFWIDRSGTFLRALQSGDFAATAISTHPGVTTMWLGSIGILLRRFLFDNGLLLDERFPIILTLMRVPVGITHTAGVLLGYLLLKRLFAPSVAFLAAMLWATDPFVCAFSRILHVDGLTTTFAMLSLLAACVYWNGNRNEQEETRPNPVWLVVSGICATLAVLSKSPGLAVVPVVSLLALATALVPLAPLHTSQSASSATSLTTRLLSAAYRLGAWGIVCVLTAALVWPAVLADPLRVYELLRVGVEVEGSTRHVIVNYFLGQQDPVPGPLYYPVVLAIRMTPWVLLGLVLVPLAFWLKPHSAKEEISRKDAKTQRPGKESDRCSNNSFMFGGRASARERRTLATLAGFVILFTVAMSFFDKKLDRYLVIVFPAVNILAAYGLSWAIGAIARRFQPESKPQMNTDEHRDASVTMSQVNTEASRDRGATIATLLSGVLVLGAIINAAWWHPYGVAYFNQALGGIQMGVRTVLIGEGEGLGDAAAWLNEQPDITGVTTVSTMIHTLQAFLRDGAQAESPKKGKLDSAAGYVLIYIRHMQRWGNDPPPPYDQFYGKIRPLHVVSVHGVDYAHIYQVPPPAQHILNARFGEQIGLYGYSLITDTIRSTGRISLTTHWKASAPPSEDYMLFMHVLDSTGQVVAQVDVPPAGPDAPTSLWQPDRYITWVHPIPVSVNVAPGTYWLAIGVYRPDDFRRLAVQGATQYEGMPNDGTDVLFLAPFGVE